MKMHCYFDFGGLWKHVEQCFGEESCTAVSIDKEILIRRNKIDNQIAQCSCNLIIGLRENTPARESAQGVMPIGRISLPQFRQRSIHFVAGDGAPLDVDQAM